MFIESRKKNGVEENLLSKADAHDDEVVVVHYCLNAKRFFWTITPVKLNVEDSSIDHTPCVTLGNTDDEIKQQKGFKSEKNY